MSFEGTRWALMRQIQVEFTQRCVLQKRQTNKKRAMVKRTTCNDCQLCAIVVAIACNERENDSASREGIFKWLLGCYKHVL